MRVDTGLPGHRLAGDSEFAVRRSGGSPPTEASTPLELSHVADTHPIAIAASGRAGAAGLCWLLLGPVPRTVIRRGLEALVCEPRALGACHLRHARFRLQPDAKLATYYHTDIRSERFGGPGSRAIVALWKPKWIGKNQPTPDVSPLEAEALQRGLAPLFRRLDHRIPEWGLHIQVWPLDFSFPQLVHVSDPEFVSDLLSHGQAPVLLPAAGRCRITPVRYQPGQRHVLRYDFADRVDGTLRTTVFAKLYRNGDGRRLSELMKDVAAFLAERQNGVTCLQPLMHLPAEDVIFYPMLCGSPLTEQLRRPTPETRRWLECAGQAISALHCAPQTLSKHLSLRGFECEIGEVWEKSHYLAVLLPSVASEVEELLRRARQLYPRLPQEPATFIHGDLKTEHFWVTPRGLTLMDLDACHLGDPALDLGQLLADLRLWQDAHGQAGIEDAQASFLAGCAPTLSRSRLLRARLFEALELVRIAGRRVPLFARDWGTRVEGLVQRAGALLEGLSSAPR